jgi:hypothetical protein
MSRTSKAKPARASSGVAAPPVDEALTALLRRSVRAWVWLAVRVVALALLTSVLAMQLPWVRQNKGLVDALSGVLVLWPFFTATGRNWAWRIALGRAYAREGRWAEAERALSPLALPSRQIFDATGEGAYWLAVALREQGQGDPARRLFEQTARGRRGEWADRAAAEGAKLP